ncbi:MAG: hypothetical protein DWQ34_18530 [Planctomycetota bacterium]|nr:MAG: hypothetical protein DWQ34_18530 [Planctomycetota bacterium]REK21273.1 MAG: hypothetical protein DWQ41_21965 [Planctomycetota bacterium]REK32066.1 MAG: hypothetical protein DWQ45_18055 [Planctomycetota bacterium]
MNTNTMTNRRVFDSLNSGPCSRGSGEKLVAGGMRPRGQAGSDRAGLAPLELVLSVPMLMMILSMMIIVGTAGSWKLRTLANSRQAAARSIWPRDGENDPYPDSWWPASASMNFRSASPSPVEIDPFAQHYVVRGPIVPSPGGGQPLRVIDDTLDMTLGLEAGFAEVDRDLPLWKQLPHRNHYSRDTLFFSGEQWQHGSMGISNNTRRMLVTYEYDLARYDPAATQQMMAAANALVSNPMRQTMFILDRDDELRTWYSDPYTPYSDDRYDWLSFYPPVARGCDLDLRPRVDVLISAVENVPRQIAQRFRRMYEEQLNQNPPPPNASDLQQKIQQLDEFIASLPQP